MLRKTLVGLSLSILALVLTSGCGRAAHEMEVAPVSGVLRLDGEPVTEGYVTFTPEVTGGADPLSSGKSAGGQILSDGTFAMTTYSDGDGALIGTHTARFFRPDPEDDEQVIKERYVPGGESLKVEVQPGKNVLEINLHRKGEAEITSGG